MGVVTNRIAVIGMGYVGIPVAALLADVEGFDVTGIQRRSKRSGWKIEVLNAGKSPFEGNEPGLAELLARVVKKGTFRVTDDYSIIKNVDTVLIDVQTPAEGRDHKPQYNSLKQACTQIGKYMRKGTLVILESTVAPGTTQHIVQPILEKESGFKGSKDFYLAYSYERVMPGKLIEFIKKLPRIIGGICPESTRRAVALYEKIVDSKIFSTDVLTAETAKTVENAYRDVNIAFANEMALVAESLGVDIYEIRELINSRPERYMHLPGSGVGGHCLPKDTWLLRYGLKKYGKWPMETEFIKLARSINDSMPVHMARLISEGLKEAGRELTGARISILGVAYLEDSDDIRNTPAAALIDELLTEETEIIAHDPYVRNSDFDAVPLTSDLGSALKDSDCAAIVTKHSVYYSLDLKKAKSLMRTPLIVDGRNVIDKKTAESEGFIYKGIGKGK